MSKLSVVLPAGRPAARTALTLALAAVFAGGMAPRTAGAAPEGGTVRAGSASIVSSGTSMVVEQASQRAIIDWRKFSIGVGEQVRFVQPGASAAVLNRVTGDQVSVLLGRLDANGQVFLSNPNGVVIGKGGQVNVAGFLATTANLANDAFMAGRLVFDQPGRAGAGVVNAGSITAAEGGLVALVAPHVRNDGLIVARLGTVALGAGDTFTLDLYGDQLLQLAMPVTAAGQLHAVDGRPVTSLISQGGRIESGTAVLVSAATARGVLDSVINLDGIVRATGAREEGGRIVLDGGAGAVTVAGTLDVAGTGAGQRGGQIDVLGGTVRLTGSALLDADGAAGGGTIQVGGAWQGGGTIPRATATTVDAGALLRANARAVGDGGEVVVWADGHTAFAGTVEARGGAAGGAGGRLEVSGKNTLDFAGFADASAVRGADGLLLLDPATIDIDATNAALISRVLRTGTSTTVQASEDIRVGSPIDGRGYLNGGGLTLDAGNAIQVNEHIVTANGAVNLLAGSGGVQIAPGKVVYAGTAPITVNAAGDVAVRGAALTAGNLMFASRFGSVLLDQYLDPTLGPVTVNAALDIDFDQPVAVHANGSALQATAGRDLRVDGQIDGRGGVAGGSVSLSAGRDLQLNRFVLTNDGALTLTAGGTLGMANGTGLAAGNGAITITGAGNVMTGPILTSGPTTVQATGGNLVFGGTALDGTAGAVTLTAAGNVTLAAPVVNARAAAPLAVSAGGAIHVNAQVDGRDGNLAVPGGRVTLQAGSGINLNASIVTENAPVTLTTTGGTISSAAGQGVFAGSGAVALTSAATLTTGALVTTGPLNLLSTAGSVQLDTAFTDPANPVGALMITAAQDVRLNQPIANTRAALTVNAGGNLQVNAPIDGRDGDGATTGGAVSLTAGGSVVLNQNVTTDNAALLVTAGSGTLAAAPGKGLFAGSGALSVTTGGTLDAGILATTGALTLRSTAGAVNLVNGIADTVGPVAITAATAVNVNQPITNLRNGSALTITAGTDLNVNARIDGTGGTGPSGTATLTAGNHLNVNEHITTADAALNLTTTTGSVMLAPGKQVRSGSGPLTIVSGGDFSTGAPAPAVPDPGAPFAQIEDAQAYVSAFLKDYVQLVTSGALNITSTNGSVFVDAPIADTTGAVTLSAGNAVQVRGQVQSNHQPIVIHGGSGGVIVHDVDESCGVGNCYGVAAVDAREANLTIHSIGNVVIAPEEVASQRTLTIDTRGQLTGAIGYSQRGAVGAAPQVVNLTADAGMPQFNVALSGIGQVNATSINGSIKLGVFEPGRLRITTGCATCDIDTGGFVGPDVVLNAGGSINLRGDTQNYGNTAVQLSLNAGRDIVAGSMDVSRISMTAGRDVRLGRDPESLVWIGVGAFNINAGRDIVVGPTAPIHVSGSESLNFTAGRSVVLNQLEMLGPVSITARTGSILLNEPIGPHIPDFDVVDRGVASVLLSAPAGPIVMRGARAAGNINITAGGNLYSTREITSVLGTVTLTVGGTTTILANPIGSQAALLRGPAISPVGPPGPLVPPPDAPAGASVTGPGLPSLPDIVVTGLPGGAGDSIVLPGGATGTTVALPGSSGGDEGSDTSAAQRAAQGGAATPDDDETDIVLADGGTLVFGGRDGAGLASVPCPPGVASGSTVRVRGAGGQERVAVCR